MSSPDRRAILGGLAAALGGCGFTPVYGPGGEARALRGAVLVEEPGDDFGFAFTRQVEERLGDPGAPRFDLAYDVETGQTGLGIDGSNEITRITIEGVLLWTLKPRGGDAVLLSGREVAFVGYAASGSTISTFQSERDAVRRLAIVLADAVVTRLLAEAPGLA